MKNKKESFLVFAQGCAVGFFACFPFAIARFLCMASHEKTRFLAYSCFGLRAGVRGWFVCFPSVVGRFLYIALHEKTRFSTYPRAVSLQEKGVLRRPDASGGGSPCGILYLSF